MRLRKQGTLPGNTGFRANGHPRHLGIGLAHASPSGPGIAQTIPKGADLVVQIHYHPSGRPEQNKSAIGLKFTGKPNREVELVLR
jgi:hypothetical protein